MSQVDIQNITKSFGSFKVLDDINISIRDGEFLTLVGPSGCGKSTLVRIIAGLESQSAGTISVDGASVNHLCPHERKLSMVFQSYALYPHMTAFDNIAVPLTVEKLSLLERIPLFKHLSPRRKRLTQEIAQQVEAVAGQLKIEALLGRKPAQLSGGQRQRVALGRAMVRQPRAFLMDEPLSNLDAKLRVHMRTELTELHKRMGATFIYVTHDQIEAMTMSDRVAMMDGGKVQQLGTPTELYEHPTNLEVARFIGSPTINTMPASIGPAGRVEIQGRPLGIAVNLPQGESVTIGIRPEALDLLSLKQTATGQPIIDARLRRTENLGAEFLHHLDLTGTEATSFIMRTTSPHEDIHEGDAVRLTFDPTLCHIFGPDGRRAEKTHVLLSGDDSGRAKHGSTR